jgi:2-methylcitrate dehydratase PrpD
MKRVYQCTSPPTTGSDDLPFLPTRRLLLQGTVAGALATAIRAGAQSPAQKSDDGTGDSARKDGAAVSPLMLTLSAYIAEARQRPLPEAIVEGTKHHLLDTVAAMVSGVRLAPGERAIAFVKTLGGTKEACIPGTKIVTNAINAAMAGGMLAHADETDDTHALAVIHPGSGVVPAALAMAQREKASGQDLLRAVALGYDIAVRLSLSLGAADFDAAGRDTHGFGCTFGAAAVASSLARLNAEQVRHVLAYAAQQASGVSNFAQDFEHVQKAFQYAAMPARNGVTAALVVTTGWTGVKDVFSGEKNFFFAYGGPKSDQQALVRELGVRYEVVGTNIKRWSVGGPIQAPLDSLSAVIREYKVKPDDVEKVVVRVSHQGAETTNNRTMPNICMQHLIAVMLIDGTVTLQSANDRKRMEDPKVLALRQRVELLGDDEMDRVRPVRQGIVEIRLRDGRELRHHTKEVRGMAQNPMTRDEIDEKCFPLLAPGLGKQKARRLIDAVWRLEQVNDVGTLRPLLMA